MGRCKVRTRRDRPAVQPRIRDRVRAGRPARSGQEHARRGARFGRSGSGRADSVFGTRAAARGRQSVRAGWTTRRRRDLVGIAECARRGNRQSRVAGGGRRHFWLACTRDRTTWLHSRWARPRGSAVVYRRWPLDASPVDIVPGARALGVDACAISDDGVQLAVAGSRLLVLERTADAAAWRTTAAIDELPIGGTDRRWTGIPTAASSSTPARSAPPSSTPSSERRTTSPSTASAMRRSTATER